MQESSKERYKPDAIRNLDTDFILVECLEKLGLEENPFVTGTHTVPTPGTPAGPGPGTPMTPTPR